MNDLTIAVNKLSVTVEEHRKRERLTCRTTCWCWDAEALLLALEVANLPMMQAQIDSLITVNDELHSRIAELEPAQPAPAAEAQR